MKVPVDTYEETLQILKLENYPKVMELLDYPGRKTLALYVAQAVVEKGAVVPSADDVRRKGGCVGRSI